MKTNRLFLPWTLLAGLLALAVAADGLKATSLVLSKLKQAQTSTTTEAPSSSVVEGMEMEGDENNTTTRSLLTGIPQKDYVHDPNLPRELNGFNLSDYPFYDRVPEEMDFKCDGLHDGFYASVVHQCQVYHHCLHDTRFDFLCANYTAFDQKTFICHFASEVDCVNSPKYFKRNEALYKTPTTTTVKPSTTTPPPTPAPSRRPQAGGGRRKRPFQRTRRPVYDYYYDDDYEDEDYYDDDVAVAHQSGKGGPRRMRKHPRRPASGPDTESERRPHREQLPEDSIAEDTASGDPKPISSSLYDRPRVPPKVRRPVPLNERGKYDYNTRPTLAPPPSTTEFQSSQDTSYSRPNKKPPPRAQEQDDREYYDDEEEYVPPARSRSKNPAPSEYYPPSGGDRDIVRRPPMSGAGRPNRRRPAGGRRRPGVETATPYTTTYEEDYDYDFDDEPRRPSRPGRKRPRQPARQDQDFVQRPYNSQRNSGRYDAVSEEPIPAPRPAFISPSGARQGNKKRPQPAEPDDEYSTPQRSSSGGNKRPTVSRKQVPSRYADESDDDYYDDEIEDEPVYRRPRPSSSRGSYKQDEAPVPSRSQMNNKRPFTSPGRTEGNTPSRTSQTSKNIPPNASDIFEDRSGRVPPSQSPTRSKPESDPLPTRSSSSGFRPKTNPPPVAEELDEEDPPKNPSLQSYNQRTSSVEEERPTSNEFRPKEPAEDSPPRIPPSSYGSFRTKLSQSERESTFRVGNFKNRPFDPDSDTIISSTSRPKVESEPIPPSASAPAPAKDNYRPPPSNGDIPLPRSFNPRPVKVIVKPIDRESPRIPDNISERQNLADISEHEYDVTLNDALHPTLHPTRSIPSGFVLPQRPDIIPRPSFSKTKSNYISRASSYQPSDEPTTASGRGSFTYLEGSASQTHVTRTVYPLHDKYDSTTDSSYRARRPVPQYEDPPSSQVRYRQLEETPYQQRANWNRREPSGNFFTN